MTTNISYLVGNVYNSELGIYGAAPVTAYLGNVTSGASNIYVASGSTDVIGYSTNFSSIFGKNYVLRNSAGTYVGRILQVNSATSATLTSGAAIAVTANVNPTNFRYQTYQETPITFDTATQRFTTDPHLGNGNITVSNTSNTISGTSTIFSKQFDVGYQIFANTYAIDGQYESLLGVVKQVTSNTQAVMTTVSGYTLTNTSYRFFDPVTPSAANSSAQSAMILNNALLQWSRSGLIPNVTQVKSYHPPVQDPVTGILVNFPATMHTSKSARRIKGNRLTPIDSLGHASRNDNTGRIHDFDSENAIVGSSTKNAIESIPINSFIKKLAASATHNDSNFLKSMTDGIKNVYGKPYIPPAPGLTFYANAIPTGFTKVTNSGLDGLYIPYEGPGANVIYVLNESLSSYVYPTVADQLAICSGFPLPPRIVNNRSDANAYYTVSNPISNLTESQKADLAARSSSQFSASERKAVKITGVPAAIPGLLNVVLMDEHPANRQFSKIEYDQSYFSTTIPNPNIPISTLNPPPALTGISTLAGPRLGGAAGDYS